jgi:3'-phosphoadenosine 5'-phosphosulfate sulfotransferase (PAPS reductase)/FAD synthetase
MKYIITESRLDKVVTEYLNEIFPLDDVNYLNPIEYNDDTREEYEDETRVEFYLGDYEDGETTIFKWYDCKYFYPDSPVQNICPTVVVEHPYDDTLIAYFSDKWEEPFKKWFTENFNLPVNTVEWKRMIG